MDILASMKYVYQSYCEKENMIKEMGHRQFYMLTKKMLQEHIEYLEDIQKQINDVLEKKSDRFVFHAKHFTTYIFHTEIDLFDLYGIDKAKINMIMNIFNQQNNLLRQIANDVNEGNFDTLNKNMKKLKEINNYISEIYEFLFLTILSMGGRITYTKSISDVKTSYLESLQDNRHHRCK